MTIMSDVKSEMACVPYVYTGDLNIKYAVLARTTDYNIMAMISA